MAEVSSSQVQAAEVQLMAQSQDGSQQLVYLQAAQIVQKFSSHPRPMQAAIDWVFRNYQPLPAAQLQALLAQHKGREEQLLTILVKYYIVDGHAASAPAETPQPQHPQQPEQQQQQPEQQQQPQQQPQQAASAEVSSVAAGTALMVDDVHAGPSEVAHWQSCVSTDTWGYCLDLTEALRAPGSVKKWCYWAERNLPKGATWARVDFSSDCLVDADMENIVTTMMAIEMYPWSLAFHGNQISCRGAATLQKLLQSAACANQHVRELRLSENNIAWPGAMVLMEAAAVCRQSDGQAAYPVWDQEGGCQMPLWLCLEGNLIDNPANFAASAQQELCEKRREAGLAFEGRKPVFCEGLQQEWPSRSCIPIVHLSLHRQSMRNTPDGLPAPPPPPYHAKPVQRLRPAPPSAPPPAHVLAKAREAAAARPQPTPLRNLALPEAPPATPPLSFQAPEELPVSMTPEAARLSPAALTPSPTKMDSGRRLLGLEDLDEDLKAPAKRARADVGHEAGTFAA